MRWKTGRRSSNIEDQRGRRAGPVAFKGGIGTIVLVLAASYFLGINPLDILMMQTGTGTDVNQTDRQHSPEEEQMADFVSVVLADTEDTWKEIFRQSGKTYQEPNLVLYSGAVQSACGTGSAAMGPFYCPGDRKVYIDLAFFDELRRTHGAPGDFAQAYVIAHEVGHHVQNLLGISDRVQSAQRGLGKAETNALSVKLELQADCFAGLWGNHADAAARCWKKAISRRRSTRPAPSAMTACRSRAGATWSPRPSPTGPPGSASNGSNAASSAATSAVATPSGPADQPLAS